MGASEERRLVVVTPAEWHYAEDAPKFLIWEDGTWPGGGDHLDAIAARYNERNAAVAMLRRLEWIENGWSGWWCMICDKQKDAGHAPDCELAALLAALPGAAGTDREG
jgi:hypothetical protein